MKTIEEPIKVVSLAVSRKKGTRKDTVDSVRLVENFGVEGDDRGHNIPVPGEKI